MDQQTRLPFLGAGGDMSARLRAYDWSATLGPAPGWHLSLKTLVTVMLAAVQPMFIAWGPQRILLYNDAYVPLLGQKHPDALGRPFFDVWPEVHGEIGPLFDQVFAGQPVHMDDITLFLIRHGHPEEAHFAFSYTPMHDESGAVAGLFCSCMETTAQVLAERSRLAETGRQRRLFQRAPGFIAILRDQTLIYEFVNDAFVRLFGARNYIGHTVQDVFPDIEGQGLVEQMARVFRTGERFVARDTPVRFQSAPGGAPEERFLDFIYEPVLDEAGNVTGLFIEGHDVTDAHRASEALRDSEVRLLELNANLERRIVERSRDRGRTWQVSPDLLAVFSLRGQFESTNPAWQAVLGWSAEELDHASYPAFVHPDDRERSHAAFEQLKRGEPVLHFENRYRCKQGGYRWLSWVGVPEAGRFFCSARDVTPIKEQAAALAERTRERDRVWRNSRDLLVIIGADGIFRAVNPAWTAILGHNPGEVVGRSFLDFVCPEDAAMTQGGLDAAAAKDLTGFENRYTHRDGTLRCISWHTSAEGNLVYAYGRDVTAAKAQADALLQTEEQLRQSQKMEAVGQLTGGLAHDFNNLLAGITGSLELMQTRLAQGRTSDLDRYLTAAQGAAKRAAALTHRLLAFTRRQTLDPRPTDLNQLVAGMDELVRRTAGPAVEVEVAAAPTLWTTLVDPNQLENALLNLCINARDAMPGGGRLTISTGNALLGAESGQDLPPGHYVTLAVADTGTGMTPEVMRRAFDPFFTTKPIGMGTGLGLSMIYGFVQQSGGIARIHSAPGQGTTVCLYLPRHHGEVGAVVEPASLATAPRAARGETVLVVDDEPTVRMLVGEVLQDLGYIAIEAADGPAGLQVLRSRRRVDLLVTDVGLPGLNGRQVADAARALRPGLKVLFITGYAETALLNHGHLEPGMHVLTKPFAMEALASRIKELIAGETALPPSLLPPGEG
ncbi:MAG TPA: PAS domain-containing protein [Acetobacteraceae bacterium]